VIQLPGQPTDSAPIESLAPPRPNLGPEPMDSDGSLAQLVIILLGGLIIFAALAGLRWWRSSHSIAATAKPPIDDSPETRLLALRERARTILAARFGPALRARTTEELADDARLAEAIGEDDLARLTELLRAGDRALFDRDSAAETNGDPSANLAAWSALLDSLARSR